MLAFLLSPLGRRIAIGAALILAFAMCLKWYGNRQWQAGKEQGQQTSAKMLEDAANKGRDEARAELQAAKDAVDMAAAQLSKTRNSVQAERTSAQSGIQSQLAAIDQKLQKDTVHAAEIPDSQLSGLIRSLNERYRAGTAAVTATHK